MYNGIETINQFLDQIFVYGTFWVYGVLFLVCFVENIFPPFPGDTFIVVAGGLISLDRISLVGGVLAIVLGGMCSVLVLYQFGSKYGRPYFLRKNFKYFTADDIHRMESRIQRWGAPLLIVSRFLLGLRSAVAIASGIAQYDRTKMIVYSTVSYLLFTGLLIYLAGQVVENYSEIEQFFRTYNRIIWPVLGVAVVLYVVRRYLWLKKTGTS